MHKNKNFFWNDEQGGVALASVLVIYGFAVLIAFVFNTGHDIVRKNEAQNAADAIAYSSGVVLARTLNTVSALNHCVGELAAISVVLESLVGQDDDKDYAKPQKKDGGTYYTETERKYNEFIPSSDNVDDYVAPFPGIKELDKEITKIIVRLLKETPSERTAFAAIYDADMMLKYYTAQCMKIKNILYWLGKIVGNIPYIGQIVAAAAAGIAIGVTTILSFEIVTEHIMLIAFDKASPLIHGIKKTIREKVIPEISTYMEEYLKTDSDNPAGYHLHHVQELLKKEYHLRECAVSPSTSNLKLPLEQEPDAETIGKQSVPDSVWNGRDQKESQSIRILEGIIKTINKIVGKIKPLVKAASWLSSVFSNSNSPFEKFLNAINSLTEDLKKVDSKGVKDSPSRKNLENNKFNIDYEKQTQLVRATNPYVDHLRSGIRTWCMNPSGLFRMNNSNFSTFFTHWTYRYTLVESYKLHESGIKLLVLNDFDPEKKGYEPWTTDADYADELFTVIAAVRIKKRVIGIGDHLFKQPNENDDTAIAQAIVYPAGGRDMDAQQNNSNTQPNTGWDTLQWNMSPNITAPEWKSPPSEPGDLIDWIRLFTGTKIDPQSKASVKLNWQTKLTPITKTKLELLSAEEDYQNTESIKEAVEFLLKNNHHTVLNH